MGLDTMVDESDDDEYSYDIMLHFRRLTVLVLSCWVLGVGCGEVPRCGGFK